MAKNKIGLQFDGLYEMIDRLEQAGASIKTATESALKSSKQIVTNKLIQDTNASNYPAKGKYSKGALKQAINTDYTVKWEGMCASIDIGYRLENGGLVSIFMLYGTPRYMKVQKLYNDLYSAKTKKEVKKAQEDAMNKVIERM